MTSSANEEPETPAPVARSGELLPEFVLKFPKDAQLDALVGAYARGDYAAIRSGAPRLAETTADPAVKAAALELAERISPDPRLRWMYLVTFLLVVLVGLYWMRRA